MKFIEKLKSIPKKKIIIVCVLIALIIATAIIAFTVSDRSGDGGNGTVGGDGTGGNSVNVFKSESTKDTAAKDSVRDTAEPIDVSGINGLAYVSKGDGTCSIKGIGSCLETELKIPAYSPSGDMVTKIEDSAFANCANILTVTIPATVKSIGTGAFRGCAELVAINVDTENTVYSSVGGVLLSKDKTVLVCFPMNRPGASYLLSTDIKAVAAYAFEGAINLRSLLYEGSISNYQKIDFLMGNGILDNISITCNYVAAK